MTVRFFFLMGHYASTLDFSNEALQAAEKGYKRMLTAIGIIPSLQASAQNDFDAAKWRQDCYDAMNDDFNTPILLAHLFEGVRIINSAKEGNVKLSAESIATLKQTFDDFFFQVLGLQSEESGSSNKLTESLMDMIIKMRAEAKANKDFATSDKLRDALAAIKVQIKDTKEGTTWSYEEN